MVQTWNGVLLDHNKEWNLTICDNMDEPRGYYTKWNKSYRKTNTIWPHLYVESEEHNKKAKTETDS